MAEVAKTSDVSHLIKDKNAQASIVKTTVHDLKVDCFAYDVAKDPVSVHVPVVRLFAGRRSPMSRGECIAVVWFSVARASAEAHGHGRNLPESGEFRTSNRKHEGVRV